MQIHSRNNRPRRGRPPCLPKKDYRRSGLRSYVGAGSPCPNQNAATKKQGTFGCRLWQRNYYEHIIRDEKELQQIREYIINNPIQWAFGEENPERIDDVGTPIKRHAAPR
jgi:REP element-mobilizing transposase RayT